MAVTAFCDYASAKTRQSIQAPTLSTLFGPCRDQRSSVRPCSICLCLSGYFSLGILYNLELDTILLNLVLAAHTLFRKSGTPVENLYSDLLATSLPRCCSNCSLTVLRIVIINIRHIRWPRGKNGSVPLLTVWCPPPSPPPQNGHFFTFSVDSWNR